MNAINIDFKSMELSEIQDILNRGSEELYNRELNAITKVVDERNLKSIVGKWIFQEQYELYCRVSKVSIGKDCYPALTLEYDLGVYNHKAYDMINLLTTCNTEHFTRPDEIKKLKIVSDDEIKALLEEKYKRIFNKVFANG